MSDKNSPLDTQVGGGHYKSMKIQPVEYIHANNIPFIEGCCIKYLSRWRDKGGIQDLKKVKHFVDLLIGLEPEEKNPRKSLEDIAEVLSVPTCGKENETVDPLEAIERARTLLRSGTRI